MSVRHVTPTDPLAAPLLDELTAEYLSRYGRRDEIDRYPAAEFAPPDGAFLVLLDDVHGQAVAGGAFRKNDAETAELKRIWTHSAYRRRGLARRVLTELESEAARCGYRRLYLTTGTRQPEARGLYLAAGYRPLFDVDADVTTLTKLPFEKYLDGDFPDMAAH